MISKTNGPAAGQSAGEAAILEAAVALFSANGYDGVSMRSVADAAGVSKANIYHHFESKEALYLAILRESASRLAGLVDELAESSGAFQDRIRDFAVAHLGHLEGNALTSRLALREAFSGDDRRSRMLAGEVFGGIFERIVAIFQEGQGAGILRPELDPALCATLMLGADVFFFQSRELLRHLPGAEFAARPAGFSQQMVDIMLTGMLAEDAAGEGVL